MLPKERATELIRDDSVKVAQALKERLDQPVASCPDWCAADLLVHLGGVHRAQANIVASRSREPMGIKREMFASVPGLLPWLESSTLFGGESDLVHIPEGLIPWFLDGSALLVQALTDTPKDTQVWSWSSDKTVGHYLRMMPIETAIHRWDAEAVTGVSSPIPADLAIDGVKHCFEIRTPARRAETEAPSGNGETFAFVATDAGRVGQYSLTAASWSSG